MVNTTGKPPGVLVFEVSPAGPIAPAGTSTPAFLGVPAAQPAAAALKRPAAVTSWRDYQKQFGDLQDGLQLPFAVRGFFENGGSFAYIVPLAAATGEEPDPGEQEPEQDGDAEPTRATAAGVSVTDLAVALDNLAALDDVSIVCVPGETNWALQQKVIEHCETLQDRVAILDGARNEVGAAPPPGPQSGGKRKRDAADAEAPSVTPPEIGSPLAAGCALQEQIPKLSNSNGYAAVYWPWINVANPFPGGSGPVAVAPSGHLAGIYARSDNLHGVHKAPANEVIRGALSLDYRLNDSENGQLNDKGVNALREFAGRPPTVWGARTTAPLTDVNWRYVNVRRLMAFIEDSLKQGTRWAVFEPNNYALWKGLERTVTAFLTRIWEVGALFGASAGEAFYVKIDDELNPFEVRSQGQVVMEIGVAPVQPAEFVVLQIGLWNGGSRINEG